MIELDYAFLADYAVVQEGKLTAVGASFTKIRTPTVPAQMPLSVAGRIRTSLDVTTVGISLKVTPPDGAYHLDAHMALEQSVGAQAYAKNKAGVLFSVQLNLPITSFGLYVVSLDLEGSPDVDRVLKFEVEQA